MARRSVPDASTPGRKNYKFPPPFPAPLCHLLCYSSTVPIGDIRAKPFCAPWTYVPLYSIYCCIVIFVNLFYHRKIFLRCRGATECGHRKYPLCQKLADFRKDDPPLKMFIDKSSPMSYEIHFPLK